MTRPQGRPSQYPAHLLDFFSLNPGASVHAFRAWFGTSDSYVYKVVARLVREGLLTPVRGGGKVRRFRATRPLDQALLSILARGSMPLDDVAAQYGCCPTYFLETASRLRKEGRIVLRDDGSLAQTEKAG